MVLLKMIGKKALPVLLCAIMAISSLPLGGFTALAEENGGSQPGYGDEAGEAEGNENKQLDTPVITAVSNAATGAKISWKKVNGAEKYRVFYRVGNDSWHKIADTSETSYVWSKAKSGTNYTFTVRCVSADGSSFISDYNRTGLDLAYVAAPKASLVTKENSIEVKWNSVNGAEKYRVLRKTDAGTWKKVADTASTSYTFNGIKLGEKYTFTVGCIDKKGETFVSSYDPDGQSVTVVAAPKLSSVSTVAKGIEIKWGKVSGAEKYRVFYKTGNSGWTKIGDTTSTSYTWKEATGGKKYTFTVRCINKEGKSYAGTFDSKGLSLSFAGTPKISSVSTVSGGVEIKWNKPAGATKYRVYYKNSTGWTKIGETTSTSYTWKGAKVGKSYAFTVRCVSSDTNTFNSGYDAAGTKFTYLATPKLSSVAINNTGIEINWNKVSGAEKYRVFYKTASSGWTKIANTTGTSYTWTGAKSGTNYTFTVRCISADGKSYTSWYDGTGKSLKFIGTPKLTSVSAESNGITIKWNKVTGAEKYKIYRKNSNGGWTNIGITAYTSFTDVQTDKGKTYTYTVRCVNKSGSTFTSGYDTKGKSATAIATPSRKSDMIEVAKKELGNVGGRKYWTWAGYSSRVPWCNIFVTWCADQLGYYKADRIPLIRWPRDSVIWFKDRGLFKGKSYEPKPGDLIYFVHYGENIPTHIGMVEKYENGIVYAIEGNANDVVSRATYEHDSYRIYGYVTPDYGHN